MGKEIAITFVTILDHFYNMGIGQLHIGYSESVKIREKFHNSRWLSEILLGGL